MMLIFDFETFFQSIYS